MRKLVFVYGADQPGFPFEGITRNGVYIDRANAPGTRLFRDEQGNPILTAGNGLVFGELWVLEEEDLEKFRQKHVVAFGNSCWIAAHITPLKVMVQGDWFHDVDGVDTLTLMTKVSIPEHWQTVLPTVAQSKENYPG